MIVEKARKNAGHFSNNVGTTATHSGAISLSASYLLVQKVVDDSPPLRRPVGRKLSTQIEAEYERFVAMIRSEESQPSEEELDELALSIEEFDEIAGGLKASGEAAM